LEGVEVWLHFLAMNLLVSRCVFFTSPVVTIRALPHLLLGMLLLREIAVGMMDKDVAGKFFVLRKSLSCEWRMFSGVCGYYGAFCARNLLVLACWHAEAVGCGLYWVFRAAGARNQSAAE